MACSDRSVIPEICEGAAIYFDPDKPEAIRDSVFKIMTDYDLNRDLRAKAKERSNSFGWDIAAQKTLRFFDEVVGRVHSSVTVEDKY